MPEEADQKKLEDHKHETEHHEKKHYSEHKSSDKGIAKAHKIKLSKFLMVLTIFIAIIVVINSFMILSLFKKFDYIQSGGKTPAKKTGTSEVQLDFYVMSYCPYGNQMEEVLAPVYEEMKDEVDFNPHYVIYSNYRGGGPNYCLDAENKYCSMHGIQELNQGIRELCYAEEFGMDAYFKFVLEMNTKCNSGNADTCWEGVANDLGLEIDKIKDCEKEKGIEFSAKELELNQKFGVSGSPTVFINNKPYSGARSPQAVKQAICQEFGDKAPSICGEVIQAEAPSAAAGGCG